MQLYRRWARWALLNLLIVSAAGVLLRYKILFPLPAIDHKNLLHGHSHFAFSGWVSLCLCVTMAAAMKNVSANRLKVYTKLFILAQVASFGMLITFPFMGYKAPSIAFSTLSIIFSYLFAAYAWRDINNGPLSNIVRNCFKAALAFYVISSLGAFHLAYLMAAKTGSQPLYIGSVYFFLHFQYNGWFLFAILGLFFYQLQQLPVMENSGRLHKIFLLLCGACFPAVLLSALWMRLPVWMHWLAVAVALVQLMALVLLWKTILPLIKTLQQYLLPATKWLWVIAGVAFTIKFLLQGLSVIPQLSYLAFGFRPVVIGYLHLVLLALVTLFLFGYLLQQRFVTNLSVLPFTGLVLFVGGVLLNEILLMLQGIAAINNTGIPVANYLLLATAIIMFAGLALFVTAQWKTKAVDNMI